MIDLISREAALALFSQLHQITHLLEAIRALPAAQVKVKPLVWYENHDLGEGGFIAKGAFDTAYHAMDDGWSYYRRGLWANAASLSVAKAAAQADYEARILAVLDLSPTAVDASQTPDPVVNDHQYSPIMDPNDAGDCRLCGASMSAHFATSGAERRWIEDTEAGLYDDPVLTDPRVKALVEQVRALLAAADGESYAAYNAALEATDAALRAIGGEA